VDVRVPELRQRLRGECRAGADGAVEEDRLRLVRRNPLDAALQVAARHVNGARKMPLLPLVDLAHVHPEGAVERLGAGGVKLRDLGLCLREQVAVCSHPQM